MQGLRAAYSGRETYDDRMVGCDKHKAALGHLVDTPVKQATRVCEQRVETTRRGLGRAMAIIYFSLRFELV